MAELGELSHLVHVYVASHTPSTSDLKKYKILKELRKNKNVAVLLKPDKGNGIVVLDRDVYDLSILNIINDNTKFKVIANDPTLQREAKLQRYLRGVKAKGKLSNTIYDNIYPVGSQPARIYGLSKMHKKRDSNAAPSFRPIVSSIGTYNYHGGGGI